LYATNCQKKFTYSFRVFLIERAVGGFMGSNEKIDGRKLHLATTSVERKWMILFHSFSPRGKT
jgi:hypothetical protein